MQCTISHLNYLHLVKFRIACAELLGESLTMVLHVKGKPPTAGVCCWKSTPFPAAEPRTVGVGLGLDTWIY